MTFCLLGIVSNTGHYPLSDDKYFQSLLCIGPLARYAEDLDLVMRVITSQCGQNLRLDVPVDVRQLKVYYRQNLDRSFGILSETAEIKNRVLQAANHFMKYGASVEEVCIYVFFVFFYDNQYDIINIKAVTRLSEI